MKFKLIIYPRINFLFVLLNIGVCISSINAQVLNKESLFINDNTVFHIDSGTYSFSTGSTKTTRTKGIHGMLSFDINANWIAASNNHYVDGYARFFGAQPNVFPIGQLGIYSPILVSPSAAEGIDAAYYRDNPRVIGNIKEETVTAVSQLEYWNINSDSPINTQAVIALSWRPSSEIALLTANKMDNLTIVGWNGRSWIPIPSYIDANSFLGEDSSFDSGSISSDAGVDLSRYSYFTLGSKESKRIPIHSTIAYINKSTLSVQASTAIRIIDIYDIGGKLIISYAVAGKFNYEEAFYYAESVYVASILMENGTRTSVKLINKF